MLPAVEHVWQQYSRLGHDEDDWAQLALSEMAKIQALVDADADSLFMSQQASNAIRLSMDKFLMYYTRLCNFGDSKGKLLFTMAPKFHMAWHWAYRTQFLSPRRGACFLDEDFVGHIKGICQQSVAGTPLHVISSKVATKYRWGKYLLQTHECKG